MIIADSAPKIAENNLSTINDFRLPTHDGVVTVQNTASGKHRTFRIRTQPDNAKFAPGQRILALLTGSDNNTSYTQIGWVQPSGAITLWPKFRTEGYNKLIDVLLRIDYWQNRGFKYMYEGRCCRCFRRLTTPDSVTAGIGPECAKRG